MRLSPGSSEVVQEFKIHYCGNQGLYLLGKIIAVQEEGFGNVNWFNVEIAYPSRGSSKIKEEISEKALGGYRELKRGGPEFGPVEESIINWCIETGLPISENFPPQENWHKKIEYGTKLLEKIRDNQKIVQEEQKRTEDDEFYKDWISMVDEKDSVTSTG